MFLSPSQNQPIHHYVMFSFSWKKNPVTVLQGSITSMCAKMDQMYAALQTSSMKVVHTATPQKPTMTHRKASSTVLVSANRFRREL